MLRKQLTGNEILEMVKKQLREEGLEFVSLIDDELGLKGGPIIDVEVRVSKPKSGQTFPDGVRKPWDAPVKPMEPFIQPWTNRDTHIPPHIDRGILDTPRVVSRGSDTLEAKFDNNTRVEEMECPRSYGGTV